MIEFNALNTIQIFLVLKGLFARYNEKVAYGYPASQNVDVDNLTYDINNGLLALAGSYNDAAFLADLAINRDSLTVAEFGLLVLGEDAEFSDRLEFGNYVLRGIENRLLELPSGEADELAATWLELGWNGS